MEELNCAWPIIYVRGYAMTQAEIDETTADPFCGFNLGSTMIRATPGKNTPPRKFVFESPLVRLQSDFGYRDVYENGLDIDDPEFAGKLPKRSVIIYRYYDPASSQFGDGKTPDIKQFAKGLGTLILRVRDLVCADPDNAVTATDFRCYLVAHSMGGLVCRAFLQNEKVGSKAARACVDKFFTYATPHNGIDMAGVNVPSWLTANDISNFSRPNMAKYLALGDVYEQTKRVDWMPESAFASRRVFCMVGTNRGDYEVAAGLSRAFAGHGSDGLVRIDNASVWGVDDQGAYSAPSATAYAYRAHSGRYGIVNSEESYQNLVRFLFGDVRVDLWADFESVRVPQELEAADQAGTLNGVYQIEVLAAPRGKRWFLTRRVSEEDSVACRDHAVMRASSPVNPVQVYLSTVFLANRYRTTDKETLAYVVTLGVRVPDYEVEKRFWPDRHYEGQYLFRDSVVIEMWPPQDPADGWRVTYNWQSSDVGQSEQQLPVQILEDGKAQVTVDFETGDRTAPRSPGVSGKLRFVVTPWNQ